MNNLECIARKYRLRAQQLRAIAAVDCSKERREALSQVARDYTLMACAAAAIERTYQANALEHADHANAVERAYPPLSVN